MTAMSATAQRPNAGIRRHCWQPAQFGLAMIGAITATSAAGVTVLEGEQGWNTWSASATGYTTVDFTDLSAGELVAPDRYIDSGLLITDFEGNFGWVGANVFPLDGYGLFGYCVTEFTLLTPSYAFATHFPGEMEAWLYSGSTLVAAITQNLGGSGANFFAGFLSDTAFDRVVFKGVAPPPPFPCDVIYFDNVYFSVVPGPAAFAVLGLGAVCPRGRRRPSGSQSR